MKRTLHLQAPAKVNFRLDVLRRRPDGYHDLRMLMQRIGLCDELEISLRDTPGISVRCAGADLPENETNLVWRAAAALLDHTDRKTGVDIMLTKNIPVAAGLGGGSSDAAATLCGLNELLGLGLAESELMRIGLTLGADVPFFIFGTPAIATGVGEVLTPLEGVPALWLLLVNPGIHVSTAWVYQNLQLTTDKVAAKIPVLYKSADDLCAILANDLEAVTLKKFPVILEIKEQLMAAGARGALMSGSGPTVFAIFSDEGSARRAAETIGAHQWFTAVVPTI
jgi:4-diphosphocytidyl-2-C-methyl-D-erythritol kinase